LATKQRYPDALLQLDGSEGCEIHNARRQETSDFILEGSCAIQTSTSIMLHEARHDFMSFEKMLNDSVPIEEQTANGKRVR
jgi:hypothetical protein